MSSYKRKFTAAELTPGKMYCVSMSFMDYDQRLHPVGESWRFVSRNFLPYEDGLTLFVEQAGTGSSFRLQWRDDAQAHIIDNFSDYVEEV